MHAQRSMDTVAGAAPAAPATPVQSGEDRPVLAEVDGGRTVAICPRCGTSRILRTFKPQFAPLVEAGTKLQTVRRTPKRMPAKGWLIDCRAWTGRPYNSEQRPLRVAEITFVAPVGITSTGVISIDGRILAAWEADDFAKQDGFRDANQMVCWFEDEHGLPFTGIVIQWRR